MNQTFIIETGEGVDSGTESEFCALLVESINLWRAGEFQASLDTISEAEPMLPFLSDGRKGRFHNAQALALRGVGKLDPAIIAYTGASVHFEAAGELESQAIVKNNAAWCYSLLGNHELAHESVDKAISLVTDNKALLAEFYDQKSKICENEVKIKHTTGLECLTMNGQVMVQGPSPDSPSSPQRTDEMLQTARINAERIIRDNHELAAYLIGLILTVADPNGDPDKYSAADATMAFLFAFTPRGEQSFRSYLAELQPKPETPQVQVQTESELSS